MHGKTACALGLVLLAAGCRKAPAPPPAAAVRVSAIDVGTPANPERLLEGIFPTNEGNGGWRWTAQTFRVALDPAEKPARPQFLEFTFAVPDELLAASGSVTLAARVNGTDVGRKTCAKPGKQTASWEVPAAALRKAPANIEFAVDRTIQERGRQQALIAMRVELKPLEETEGYLELSSRRAREAYWRVLESRKALMPPERQHELIRLYHELPVWESTWFHGVRIFKNPLDLWMVEQIMHRIQPRFVVETGTFRGASALFYAQVLEGLGLNESRVLTVDIADYNQAAAAQRLWKRVTFFHGSSTDERIVGEMAKLTRGATTLVALDSDHSMKHVLNELRMYAPMVSPGSYIVVEDTHMDGAGTHGYGVADPGPLAAVEQFLREEAGKNFERDLTQEPFVMSWNTGGWLKRKR